MCPPPLGHPRESENEWTMPSVCSIDESCMFQKELYTKGLKRQMRRMDKDAYDLAYMFDGEMVV